MFLVYKAIGGLVGLFLPHVLDEVVNLNGDLVNLQYAVTEIERMFLSTKRPGSIYKLS